MGQGDAEGGDSGGSTEEDRPLSSIEGAKTQASDEPVASTIIAPTLSGWPLASDEEEESFPDVDEKRYRVEGEHARGGIGRVMRARDCRLGRPVAIKQLIDSRSSSEARFLREARITARLEHPAIVPVHDIGRWDSGEPFYSMKMVSGQSLKERIDACEGIADRLGLLSNVIAVADAIAYAHSEGVIHRDLKPQNVIVGPFGETVVIDWGLAKDTHHDTLEEAPRTPYRTSGDSLTVVGTVMGTPAYMPPEQARGEEVDERADVYALGAILYHLLSGEAPYRHTKSADAVTAVVEGPPRELDVAGAPNELVAIARKAMSRDKRERYETAARLAEDLKRFRTGKLVSAHEYSTWALARRWLAKYKAPVAVAAIGIALLGVLGVASVRRIVRERNAAEQQRHAAETQRGVAERRAMQLLEEQGRRELLEGRHLRAAVYLSEAWTEDPNDESLGWLLADAMRPIDALAVSVEAHPASISGVEYLGNGTIATADADGRVRISNAATGEKELEYRAHQKEIRELIVSSDGTRILTASFDGTAKIWNAADGALVATVLEGAWPVTGAAISPDGTRAMVAAKMTVVMADTATGKKLWTVEVGDYAMRIHYSFDGTRAIIASASGLARIIDTHNGAVLHTLSKHDQATWTGKFSRDGTRAVTTSSDDTAKIWDTTTGALLHTLAGHTALVHDAEISPDGRFIATASNDGTARIWSAERGSLLHELTGHNDIVVSVRYDPSGSRILTASHDGTARLWDAATGRAIATFTGHLECHGAEFSPDGSRIVTVGKEGRIRIWKSTGWKRIATLTRHQARLSVGGWSADGVALTAGHDGFVHLWNADGSHRVALDGRPDERPSSHMTISDDATPAENALAMRNIRLTAAYMIDSATFSPDGSRVATTASDGVLRLFDAGTGRRARTIKVANAALDHATYSPDGAVLAATAGNSTKLFAATTGNSIASLDGHASSVQSIAFAADGSFIATGSRDKTARTWSLDGTPLKTFSGHEREINTVDASPDGRLLVTASDDGTARVWNAETGDSVFVLKGHDGEVHAAWFSPDGTRIATASADGSGRIWDAHTGELLAALHGHRNAVTDIRWSADSARVITTSDDTTARVWESRDGRLLALLRGHEAAVVSASFAPSGRVALTIGRDGRGMLWDVAAETRPPDEIARLVAERAPWKLIDGRLVPVGGGSTTLKPR